MEQNTRQVSPEQLAQHKAYKQSKESFRAAISELVVLQKLEKLNRRPDNKSGTSMSGAQTRHHLNRVDLRHLYVAYSLMRQTHGGYKKDHGVNHKLINKDYITKLMEIHGPKTVRSDS